MIANSKLQRFRTSQQLWALVIALNELQHSMAFKICGAGCSSPVYSRSHALNRCIPINPTFDRFARIHAPARPSDGAGAATLRLPGTDRLASI